MERENAEEAVKAIVNAKAVVVIIGAGISVAAGIPSFQGTGRIADDLQGTPIREIMSARIRRDETLRKQFCNLIAALASKTITAQPTAFHRMLRALDNANSLVRLYTQNIDGLESKVGFDLLDHSLKSTCVALHGSLLELRCDNCSATRPLEGSFQSLKAGVLPTCSNSGRALPNLRQRTGSCGIFYPDIVLYDEPVKDGDHIASAVNADRYKISESTILLVAGTSLKIPGVVHIVQSLSGLVASNGGQVIYLDINPMMPARLSSSLTNVVKMDCQSFAEKVISGLETRGIAELQADAELRRDIRPLWDWN